MPQENSSLLPLFLDLENEWAWCGEQHWKLTPKAFAVLRCLVAQASRIVTKEELMHAVWPDIVVSEWVLTTCIREIRRTLGDNSRAPQYIETVHRRGYRCIAPISATQPVPSSRFQISGSETQPSGLGTQNSTLVGRETELAQLHQRLTKARHGERQMVFVTGEGGIGKTALVEAFLRQISTDQNLWIGRGQCIEHYGAGEAYLPVLEALGRLSHASGHTHLATVLRRYAPTWLAQLPALLNAAEVEERQRRMRSATRERMLREMVEALEAITTQHPLILWLEDLQWSDSATVDLLTYLARRSGPAQLLVMGSYRPVDVIVRGHPLSEAKQELLVHGCCTELALELLSKEAIARYLTLHFPSVEPPFLRELTTLIHQRTEGNPLFMVNVVDFVAARGLMEGSGNSQERWASLKEVVHEIPLNIRQMITHQLKHLSAEEQKVLEGASVAGMEFSAAAVAAGIKATVEEVEQCCMGLAQRGQFLCERGQVSWPDGTEAGRYGFLHSLYRQLCHERIPPARRKRLHLTIGKREEEGYGNRAGERAAAFALHFTQGGDYSRALRYREQAAANAFERYAYQEASG